MQPQQDKESERFKESFASELLEYHFETLLGKNKHNHLQWRVLLDDKIQPHADILCDFARWLLKRGWSPNVVRDEFFEVIDAPEPTEKPKQSRLRRLFSLFKIN